MSGIFLKVVGQNAVSSPRISLLLIESCKQIQKVEVVKEFHEKYSIWVLDCALLLIPSALPFQDPSDSIHNSYETTLVTTRSEIMVGMESLKQFCLHCW